MQESLSFGLKSDPRINLFSSYFTTEISCFTHLIEKLSISLSKLFHLFFFLRTLLEQLGKLPRNLLKRVRAGIKSQKNMKNL